MPNIFGEFAAALSYATETPEALSVMTILGALSAVLMQRVFVSPKANWFEPINIYTLIALPPANNKSFVLNTCMKPLVEWESEQKLRLDGEIRKLRSERRNQEKRIEVLRSKSAKAKTLLEQCKLAEEATALEVELKEIPRFPVLFVNDVTPESLTNEAYEQGGKLGIFSDEGGIFENFSGLYSQGSANIDILLKGIDGGEVRVRRKDRSFSLNPYLTILLAVQPIIISRLAEKKIYLGNGILERFLYVIPKSKLGYRSHNTPPVSTALQQAYRDRMKELLQTFLSSNQKSGADHRIILTLNPVALSLWAAYQMELEVQLRPAGKFEHCIGWAGKMSGFVLRLAGLLHIAEHGQDSLLLSENTLQNSIAIAKALGDHALAAFGLMRVDQVHADAQYIFQWFRSLTQTTFTQSELTYACRHKKWGSERITKALRILYERHLVSQPIIQPGQFKPTTVYFINPLLMDLPNKP